MVEQIGRYKIKGQLGKGAMGVVYLAEDTLLNRQAAIKTVELVEDDAAQREFLRNRLLRDARAAAGLSHPNIVAVFDVFEQGNSAYLVLEYVSGETLAATLNRTPVADPAFTVKVLRAMASALDYTHARGVVHRDIKPANVMIDLAGTPKIMDFGIARIVDTRTTTPAGMVMGTVEYMSPEQVKGEPVDGRSDQFALAAVAYRMLAGGTMFGQHSLATLAYKTVNEPPPPLCTRNAQLPAAVDAVISRALAKQPADRYATCGEFVEALAAALAGAVSAVREPTTVRTVPPLAPTRAAPLAAIPAPVAAREKSRAWLVVLLGVAVILAAGAAIFRPWETAPAEPAPVVKSEPVRKTPTTAKPTRQPAPKSESAAAASDGILVRYTRGFRGGSRSGGRAAATEDSTGSHGRLPPRAGAGEVAPVWAGDCGIFRGIDDSPRLAERGLRAWTRASTVGPVRRGDSRFRPVPARPPQRL
jgi:serine/threonine-protein kinase